MTNIFQDAKPGDEFVCRNGEKLWLIGFTRTGDAVLENVYGCTVRRTSQGRFSEVTTSASDIIRRKSQPVTRWDVRTNESGFPTLEDALAHRNKWLSDATIVRITFTPGEDQQ